MTKMYGLLGYPLSHSFSKKYFEAKFLKEGLADHRYELFELRDIKEIKSLIKDNPDLVGLNVTIPYKESVMSLLDHLDDSARQVGAINVIKIQNKSLIGYNTDFFGFESSLLNFLPPNLKNLSAVIFGTGGAAKAVIAVLKANKIPFNLISRNPATNTLTYAELNASEVVASSRLIINTTPLGMAPNVDECPNISYNQLSEEHYVFDLIYNPAETKFLRKAVSQGAMVKNGLEMLQLQADKSWEIWT